eukprot:13081826-Alexandrium_andersonii.AAC.1
MCPRDVLPWPEDCDRRHRSLPRPASQLWLSRWLAGAPPLAPTLQVMTEATAGVRHGMHELFKAG